MARGIRRAAPEWRPAASTTWVHLTARLAWPRHREAGRLTRRAARRERADRIAALGDHLEQLLVEPHVPPVALRRPVADLRALDPERAAKFAARMAALGPRGG